MSKNTLLGAGTDRADLLMLDEEEPLQRWKVTSWLP
ncbi:hypothetical protein J3A69_003812 [Pseudomonas putida]|nr:hypothetical protein L483_06480 [Pseudomonas putida H8234]MBP2084667.1 hypothetical protein [Pseudomonas sp. PvP089]MBP2089632.1 hypothetical protein [Pseudomonas sp. PvP088]MBP2224205.1 hypothetical protein [Pseudomonas putida]